MKAITKILLVIFFLLIGLFVYARLGNRYDFENINLAANLEKQIEAEVKPVEEKKIEQPEQKKEISVIIDKDTEEIKPEERKSIFNDVPFASQAPFGEWSDPKQQDGCEEAASLMAVYWAQGKKLSLELAKQEIINSSNYQEKNYNSYADTSTADTLDRIIKGYFKYTKAKILSVKSIEDIVRELYAGNIVIVPANGRLLKNPNYTPPGPERHNLLIIGYDIETKEFITNDAGTRKGKNYRYSQEIVFSAIRDYPTGNHLEIKPAPKVMISISK